MLYLKFVFLNNNRLFLMFLIILKNFVEILFLKRILRKIANLLKFLNFKNKN